MSGINLPQHLSWQRYYGLGPELAYDSRAHTLNRAPLLCLSAFVSVSVCVCVCVCGGVCLFMFVSVGVYD